MQFDMLKDEAAIIKVIGVGGGGGNAVNHMFKQGIKGVDFIICNTDAQALELSPIPNKVQLGTTLTEGRGAGSIPEVGRHSAIENLEQLKSMICNCKMIFITAGMGGGTGTGASPIIAQAAKEMGILTVGIVTTPFSFEGKRRRSQADEGLEELKRSVDTLLVISNDKLREMFGNLTLSNAFGEADDILTTAAKGIAEIITVPGYINVDFEDVRTVMKDSGAAIMGSCTAKGEDRAKKAVVGALSSPLLNDNEIEGARYILLNISSGKNEVLMDEVTIITDYIQEEAGLTADIIWGNCNDETLDDELCVTIIATGFQTRKEKEVIRKERPEKIVTVLGEDIRKEQPRTIRHELSDDDSPRSSVEFVAESPAGLPNAATEPHFEEGDSTKPISYEPFIRRNEQIQRDPFLRETAVEKEAQRIKARQVSIFESGEEKSREQNSREPDAPQNGQGYNPAQQGYNPAQQSYSPGSPASNQHPESRQNSIKPEQPKYLSTESGENNDNDPMRKTKERIARLKDLSMKLNSPKGLEDLENEPAYMRKKMNFEKLPASSANEEISRYTTDDRGEIRPNNSFLHDNVD